MQEVRFARSARKHRVATGRARQAMEAVEPEEISASGGDPALVWIGADDRGVELEVVALVLEDYLLVIHVMPTEFRRRSR